MDKRTRNKIIKYLEELIEFRYEEEKSTKDVENFIAKLEKMDVSDSMTSPGKTVRRPKPSEKSAKSPRKPRKVNDEEDED